MPAKVWLSPLYGIVGIGAGVSAGSPILIALGVLLLLYGIYRIANY